VYNRQFARNPQDRAEPGLETSIGLLSSGDNWLVLRNDHGIPMRSTVRRPTARDSEITPDGLVITIGCWLQL
jgi:hypothetical protein